MLGNLSAVDSQYKVLFTSIVGMREINFWEQCMPIAWFDLGTKTNYEQFLGRSNREFPAKLEQRGAIVINNAAT